MASPERTYAPRYGRPLYRPLRAMAASCFVGLLATDVAYWLTADFLWVDFSDWLVAGGVVIGLVALIVGLIERFARRAPLMRQPAASAGLDILAWAAGVLSLLFHTRDAWTSVVPWGVALSALSVALLLVSEILQRTARAPTVVERVA